MISNPSDYKEEAEIKSEILWGLFGGDLGNGRYLHSYCLGIGRKLFGFKNPDLEDIYQDFMISSAHGAGNYDSDITINSDFKTDSRLRTWLVANFVNKCRDFFRKTSKGKEIIQTNLDSNAPQNNMLELLCIGQGEGDVCQEVANEEIKGIFSDDFKKCVQGLSPKLGSVLLGIYIQDMSYEEFAAQEDIPVGTVKSRLHTAKEILKEYLINKRKCFYSELSTC